jgi:hypothetical protein
MMETKSKKPKVELDFLMAAPKSMGPGDEEEETEEDGEGGDADALISELHEKLDRLQSIVGSF